MDIQQILLPFTEETKESTQTQVTELMARIEKGETFEALVLEANPAALNSGKILEATREQLDVAVAEYVFSEGATAPKMFETNNAMPIVNNQLCMGLKL